MRIWSLHPQYLDTRGLVALWREGLLAQAVLKGKTKGYLRHPQLLRFKEQSLPVGFIAEYLRVVHREAASRGYRFAAAKISRSRAHGHLRVTRGQLEFEWRHLMKKLRRRDPRLYARLALLKNPRPHPLFRVVRGSIAPWEKAASAPDPEAYVAALTGWRRACVDGLRSAIRAAATVEETIKWGNLVYLANGPVLLIRAESKRVLFGFWRGKRLLAIEPRLKPSGKYEMATIHLVEGDVLKPATVRRLVREAVALNKTLGDPTLAARRK